MWIKRLFGKKFNRKPDTADVTRRPSKGRIIVFTSGKGGVGKTTCSSTVGAILARYRKKVLLIDLDTGMRNLDLVLGMDREVTFNLYDVLERGVFWQRAVVQSGIEGLSLLASDQSRQKEAIRKDGFENLLFEVSRFYDYVIIDCPAGIEYGFDLATASVDEAVVVCTPEMPSLRGASQVIGLLKKRRIAPITAVVNRAIPMLIQKGLAADAPDIEGLLGVPVKGMVPMDELVLACAHQGIPLALWRQESPAKEAFEQYVSSYFLTEVI